MLRISEPRVYLKLISLIILLAGLGSAVLIYRMAVNDSLSVLGYEIVGGQAYPIMPEDSKAYLGTLERYGGKEFVVLDEMRRWFAGLWHGKSLAFTVTFITIVVSFSIFFIANHLPSDAEQSDKGS